MLARYLRTSVQIAPQVGRQVAWISATGTAGDEGREPIRTTLGRSVLHSINNEASSSDGSWIQQKLCEERRQEMQRRRQKPSSKGAYRQLSEHGSDAVDLPEKGANSGSGFTKIGRQKACGRDTSEDDALELKTTLTPKTLKAKLKWQETEAAKERQRERLKDVSLAGWQRRKIEIKLKHPGEGWDPTKKIARSSMEKIRLLNSEFPEVWTMTKLSQQFKVSQETIRRILKTSFKPTEEQIKKRESKRREQLSEYKEAAHEFRRLSKSKTVS